MTMANTIIILFIIAVGIFAIIGSVKHFRGEGGCCGGSSKKPRKKHLKNKVIKIYTVHIEGMKCKNCAYKVQDAINDIDGAAATVQLKKKIAIVSCDREINLETLCRRIEKQGYTVSAIDD